jgi:hypothetical protein
VEGRARGANAAGARVCLPARGRLEDNLLTARVTFCSVHPGLPRYVDDLDSYMQEALLEIDQADAAAMLAQ